MTGVHQYRSKGMPICGTESSAHILSAPAPPEVLARKLVPMMWQKVDKRKKSVPAKRSLSFESLENRQLLCSNVEPVTTGEPTECEQYMLELINLARADGVEEATRNSLAGGLQEGPPTVAGQAWTIDDMVQPLAWNKSLKTAALAHATALNAADQFFAGGNPHSFGGTTPSDRIAAAGYVSGSYSGPTTPSGFRPGGENISERVKSPVSGYSDNELSAAVFDSHVGLFNDTTVPGRGHRNTMMLGAFKEFGVGISVGTDSSFNPGNPPPNWDSIYIVQEYGIPLAGINFVTGVVYQDLDLSLTNPSERLGYSAGEGLGGVTISAVPAGGGTALTTTTFASGGYSLQLADGTYDITASGAFGTTAAVTVIVAGANKKLDFVDPQASSGVDIVDDGAAGYSTAGSWGSWNQAGYLGDYQFGAPHIGSSATWSFDVAPGIYKIAATWRAGSNHASNAPFTILDGNTLIGSPTVDQTSVPNDFTDGQTSWETLGILPVSGTTLTVRLTGDAADNYVIADAIRIERIPDTQTLDDGDSGFANVGSWGLWDQAGHLGDYRFGASNTGSSATWSFDVAPGIYKIAATWRAGSNHASNAPFTILDGNTPIGSLTVDQTAVPNDFTDAQTSWETLGVLPISGTTLTVRLTGDAADNYVIADAIRIERIPDTQTLDDGDSGFANVGSWGLWDQAGHLGDYRFGAPDTGSSATWSFDVAPGIYKIAATWRRK